MEVVEWLMDRVSAGAGVLPVRLFEPERWTAPVVFASPHSGRAYSAAFVAASRLDGHGLRRSEDAFVDLLFAAAPIHGAPLLTATFPRAFCDVNREAWELDPGMFDDELPGWVNSGSPRVAAGLGTLARVVASGEAIYRDRLSFAEAESRIKACWHPFHAALRDVIAAARDRFGACLLVDCHSMPASALPPRQAADIVLGDAHGTTCGAAVIRRLEALFREQGFSVRRNDPYAGGYITRNYGRPREGVHAVQIEILRPLYMDEVRMVMSVDFPAVQSRLGSVIAALAAETAALLAE